MRRAHGVAARLQAVDERGDGTRGELQAPGELARAQACPVAEVLEGQQLRDAHPDLTRDGDVEARHGDVETPRRPGDVFWRVACVHRIPSVEKYLVRQDTRYMRISIIFRRRGSASGALVLEVLDLGERVAGERVDEHEDVLAPIADAVDRRPAGDKPRRPRASCATPRP